MSETWSALFVREGPALVEGGEERGGRSRRQALGWLAANVHTFFIQIADQKVYLVAALLGEQSYLRTSADWSDPNHLLALPSFPVDPAQ